MSHRKERDWHISYVHSHPSLAVLVMSKPAAIQMVGCHNRLIEIKSHHTEQQEFKRVTTKGRRTALRLTLLPSSLTVRESQFVSASATYRRSPKCRSEGKQCKVPLSEVPDS